MPSILAYLQYICPFFHVRLKQPGKVSSIKWEALPRHVPEMHPGNRRIDDDLGSHDIYAKVSQQIAGFHVDCFAIGKCYFQHVLARLNFRKFTAANALVYIPSRNATSRFSIQQYRTALCIFQCQHRVLNLNLALETIA